MTAASSTGADYAAVRPLESTDVAFALTLSGSSAASTNNLAEGHYAVALDKTGGLCWLAFANSVVIPTSGADAAAGALPVRDGDVVHAPGATKVAAILGGTGNTGSLGLVKLL